LALVIFYRWGETEPEWIYDTKEFLYRSNMAGTPEIMVNAITLYPNPFHNRLTISRNSTENINCTLLNSNGQKIRMIELKESNIILDPGPIPDGIYFLQYRYNNKNVTKKIIKR